MFTLLEIIKPKNKNKENKPLTGFKNFYFFIPLIFCFILIFIFYQPDLEKTIIGYATIVFLSFIIGCVLIKKNIKSQWPFLIQIILFVLTGLGFFVFIKDLFWQIIFILAFAGIFGFFVYHLSQFFYEPRVCQPDIFKKTVLWFNFIISYWFLIIIGETLGAMFLQIWFFLGVFLVFLFFLWQGYYYLFLQGVKIKEYKDNLIINALVCAELYLFLSFLPFGSYLSALLVSLFFGLIELHYFNNKLII